MSLSIACNITAITPEQRPGHEQNIRQLFSAVTQTQELADGWAFCWSYQDDTLHQLTQFVALEQKCCPFLTFTIIVEPYQQELGLKLTGSAEVKQFITAEFRQLLQKN